MKFMVKYQVSIITILLSALSGTATAEDAITRVYNQNGDEYKGTIIKKGSKIPVCIDYTNDHTRTGYVAPSYFDINTNSWRSDNGGLKITMNRDGPWLSYSEVDPAWQLGKTRCTYELRAYELTEDINALNNKPGALGWCIGLKTGHEGNGGEAIEACEEYGVIVERDCHLSFSETQWEMGEHGWEDMPKSAEIGVTMTCRQPTGNPVNVSMEVINVESNGLTLAISNHLGQNVNGITQEMADSGASEKWTISMKGEPTETGKVILTAVLNVMYE